MYNTAAIKEAFEDMQDVVYINEPDNILPLNKGIIEVEKIGQLDGKPWYQSTKRALDLAASLIALIVLCIPMLLIAIWIRLDSEGPAIYIQERLG
jgi:lipopolysaccharide/colanic/teichoic acid biosynthesis glycosyltransferase